MRLRRYAPSDSSTYLKYASGVLGRKPCIHIRLDLLATNPCEKCGLKHQSGPSFCSEREINRVKPVPGILKGMGMDPLFAVADADLCRAQQLALNGVAGLAFFNHDAVAV